jgi:hypothetical protein
MNYKVTKHYLRTKEILIAAFSYLNDAELFLAKKLNQDEKAETKVLYRIYNDFELEKEFNNGVQSFSEPEDAETYNKAKFVFDVTIQATSSLERITVAYFNNEEDAHLFVVEKCSREDKSDFGDTYLIFKDQILFATLNRTIIDNKALKSQGSAGNSTGATLSPLSSRPTPPGGPGDYWVEKKDENE